MRGNVCLFYRIGKDGKAGKIAKTGKIIGGFRFARIINPIQRGVKFLR
jgi:hypothetical protein